MPANPMPEMPEGQMPENMMYVLPPDAVATDDHRNPRRRRRTEDPAAQPDLGVTVQPEARHSLDLLVLHPEAKADLLAGLRAIERRADLDAVWGLSSIQPLAGRCILNFYGKPGTGKTRAALAIAHRLGRPLYQIDYSAVISKYIGDTAKHIARAFARAAELGAVLFFDEADSLLSRRVSMDQSCATSINQNRNVLMQCLDRFDGVVIMTTNLFGNYDEALLRRIARHIEFKLPDRAMRRKLFEAHLPRRDRVTADLDALAKASKGLSGGDIFNVCVNAIYAASTDEDVANWNLSTPTMLAELTKVREAKRRHGGESAHEGSADAGMRPDSN